MPRNVRPLKHTSNASILDAIHRDGSSEYQRRIPLATQAGVQQTLSALQSHRPLMNEFVDALVNRIGSVIARNISWTNPLAEFKTGMLNYGDTIEEIQVGLVKARTYDADREYLERDIFGSETPHVESAFHKVNRQNMYKITVNDALLARAFLDESGLSSFVSQLMQAPSTSDQWDEFLLTTSLFAEYEANGGFYHVNTPNVRDIASNGDDARIALRKMRAMADNLKFLSTKYNAAHMPTFANADDLCLFVTPEFNAAIDVEALAGAFNVDKAEMHGRVIPIPDEHFNIDGAQAIMTTRDFFVIADQRLENTSQNNPVGLHNNYFLHHWQVVSASRFVPAVMFWTGADDSAPITLKQPTEISNITVSDRDGNDVDTAVRGEIYALMADITPEDAATTAIRYSVDFASSAKTYVSPDGVLHIGADERNDFIEITATAVCLDPDNLAGADRITTQRSVLITGEMTPEWPVKHGHDNSKSDYEHEPVRVDVVNKPLSVDANITNGTVDVNVVNDPLVTLTCEHTIECDCSEADGA